jgi:hypothetical protein
LAAHGRGDYGAIVPLAREADSQKRAFAAATAEFASRVGYGGSLTAEIAPPAPLPAEVADIAPAAPAAASSADVAPELPAAEGPEAATEPPAIDADPEPVSAEPPVVGAAAPAEEPAVSADPGTPQPVPAPEPGEDSPAGRRRIRDLIRQVRSGPEEAPAR